MSNFESAAAKEIITRLPLLSRPFSGSGLGLIETLEAAEDETRTGVKNIIEERGGVHYINQNLLLQSGTKDWDLNNDFKKLVDSIIS